MKRPLVLAAQGAEMTPSFPPAAERPPVPEEGKLCSLEPTRSLLVFSLSPRSCLGADPIRLLIRTGREKLSQGLDALLMPLTPAAVRHQQKAFRPFDYSSKAARERRSFWSTVIACITGSPTTTTPPDTKRTSLQVTAPCTSDLVAIEFA